MDTGRGEELGFFFLQLAVVVFYKSLLWDQDSCMSDSVQQCSWGQSVGGGETGQGRRSARRGCDQAVWQPG